MDYAVDQVNKNPETAYEKIIDTAEKYLKDFGKGCELGLSQESCL